MMAYINVNKNFDTGKSEKKRKRQRKLNDKKSIKIDYLIID